MTDEQFAKILQTKPDCGILPPPISHIEAVNILIDHFLGDDWYVVDPISPEQVNTLAISEIIRKFPNPRR